MKKRITLILSFVLLLALVVIPAAAQSFPDPGAGTTYTELANQSSASADWSIVYYPVSGGSVPGTSSTLPGYGSVIIDPESSGLPQSFQGSAVVSSGSDSSEPRAGMLSSVVATEWRGNTGDGFQMGLYSGASEGSSEICFPSLWRSEGSIISSFAVQNTDAQNDVNISINYRARDGSDAGTYQVTIAPNHQKTFDLATPGEGVPNLGPTWQGSAKVTADGGAGIVGVAVASWGGPNPDRTRSATYNAADCSGLSGSTTLVAPTQFRVRPGGGWTGALWSAINIQNLSGNTANLTLTYVNREGLTPDLVLTNTIPPYSTIGANTRNGGNFPASVFDPLDVDEGWDGAVKIEVDQPAVATVITQWDRGGLLEAGVYAAANVSEGATKIYVPGVKRIKPSGWTDFSAVIIQNLSGSQTADVTIRYYDQAGTLKLTLANQMIDPAGALGLNTRNGGSVDAALFEALGNNFEGQAIITSNNGVDLAAVLNGISKSPDGGSATTNGIPE